MCGADIIMSEIDCGNLMLDENGQFWAVRKGKTVRAEHKTPCGYLQIRKMVNGKRYYVGAHRAVWEYFNKMPIPDGMIINHKNGQKDDNRPCNLELTTYSENQKHSYENCLSDQWGEKNPSAKLSNKQVAEIRLAYSQGGYTQQQLASKYRVAFQTISNIVRGKRRQKQGGIVGDYSYRRQSGIEKDPATGRFVGKRRAGRLLDGRTWEEVPS